jgi:NTE family protein
MQRPKIGLVLGGGGSRGLAHIGVLEVLQRENIPLDLIVGTSMGGIVAVLFALGHSPAEIAQEMQALQGHPLTQQLGVRLREHTTPLDLILGAGLGGTIGLLLALARNPLEQRQKTLTMKQLDRVVGPSIGGLVGLLFILARNSAQRASNERAGRMSPLLGARTRQQRVRNHLATSLAGKTFADLSLPVSLMAVDMRHGEEVVLNKGPLLPAVLASSAVSGAFPPVKYNGVELADGGVIDSLATHVAFEQGAEKVIAVDVYPALDTENPWTDPLSAIMGFDLPPNIFSTSGAGPDRIPRAAAAMWRSVRVMTWHLHQKRLAAHPPAVLLRPAVDNYGSLDFKDVTGPIQAGIEEAERHLAELKALIA